MNYNNPSELNRIKELIDFGKKSGSTVAPKAPVVEYQTKGADGKTYGIVNEGNKFYIKVAPVKDTQVVNEDFDYIGGFNNRKENEYTSYNSASKHLELRIKSINEAFAPKAKIELPKSVDCNWQNEQTKEMRESINRFHQLSNNVEYILAEDKNGLTMAHTVPEAPATNPGKDKVNAPFTDTAVAKGDKDFKETQEDHTKAAPFTEKVGDAEKKLTSPKAPGKGNSDETYKEEPKFAPENSVATQKPAGGKVVRVSESKTGRTFKLTKEQVLAWSNDPDFMDMSNGTEIGDATPYSEPVNEDAVPAEDVAGLPDDDDFDFELVDDEEEDVEDDNEEITDFKDIDLTKDDMNLDHADDELDAEYEDFSDDEIDVDDLDLSIDLDDDYINPDFGFDDFYESRQRKGRNVNETKLDVFGKHPAYRKKPMSGIDNAEVAPNGARDWNHDSAKGNAPFGQKIGSSAPFDDKTIDLITDAVMDALGWSKKAKKA